MKNGQHTWKIDGEGEAFGREKVEREKEFVGKRRGMKERKGFEGF